MGASAWIALMMAVAVAQEPPVVGLAKSFDLHMAAGTSQTVRESLPIPSPPVVAANVAANVAALGLDSLEVVHDESFGDSIRGANQGLDGLIGLAMLNRGGSGSLTAPSGTTTLNSGTALINAGQAPSAETQRAAQYVFVIRWIMLSTSP